MGLLIDPIPKSPNQHDENRLAGGKENFAMRSWGLKG